MPPPRARRFGNGWSKFKASTKVFKGAGLEYAKSDEFFTDIQSMVDIPSKYKKDFNDQIKWIKFFDNITWSEHNTQFASDSGGSDTMFTMYARNREDDQKIDCLFLTVGEEFKLAPNYFVISESKSILGGLFSSTKLKFKKMDAGITDEQLMFVSEYFSLLAYQQIALAEGMSAPPDPSFPTSAPAFLRFKSRDTCTGPHESCCEAPGDDPNNCPASARTSDCDAKKSCCCG